MPRRARLTDAGCTRLKPPKDKSYQDHFDSLCPRLCLTVYATGKRSWHLQFYPKRLNGRVTTRKLGAYPAMGVAAARKAARDFELNPEAAEAKQKVGSFAEIAAEFVKRHVEASGLRSQSDIERHIKYANKYWRDRPFLEIKRRDVADLLDKLEDTHGAGVATAVLSTIRKMQNWFAARADDYQPCVIKGMQRATATARERILSDDEIRAVWGACDTMPVFGPLVQVLLLTGQRRAKVAAMRWADIDADGTWTIPAEKREKGNAGQLKLSDMATTIVAGQPRIAGCPYVFGGRGGGAIAGFNKRMDALRAKLPTDMPQWQLHDLRRTARSLLSRVGVRPEVAERVLGHAMPGVEGVYDRHSYSDEKGRALQMLADLITTILTPTTSNVVQLVVAQPGQRA